MDQASRVGANINAKSNPRLRSKSIQMTCKIGQILLQSRSKIHFFPHGPMGYTPFGAVFAKNAKNCSFSLRTSRRHRAPHRTGCTSMSGYEVRALPDVRARHLRSCVFVFTFFHQTLLQPRAPEKKSASTLIRKKTCFKFLAGRSCRTARSRAEVPFASGASISQIST